VTQGNQLQQLLPKFLHCDIPTLPFTSLPILTMTLQETMAGATNPPVVAAVPPLKRMRAKFFDGADKSDNDSPGKGGGKGSAFATDMPQVAADVAEEIPEDSEKEASPIGQCDAVAELVDGHETQFPATLVTNSQLPPFGVVDCVAANLQTWQLSTQVVSQCWAASPLQQMLLSTRIDHKPYDTLHIYMYMCFA